MIMQGPNHSNVKKEFSVERLDAETRDDWKHCMEIFQELVGSSNPEEVKKREEARRRLREIHAEYG